MSILEFGGLKGNPVRKSPIILFLQFFMGYPLGKHFLGHFNWAKLVRNYPFFSFSEIFLQNTTSTGLCAKVSFLPAGLRAPPNKSLAKAALLLYLRSKCCGEAAKFNNISAEAERRRSVC